MPFSGARKVQKEQKKARASSRSKKYRQCRTLTSKQKPARPARIAAASVNLRMLGVLVAHLLETALPHENGVQGSDIPIDGHENALLRNLKAHYLLGLLDWHVKGLYQCAQPTWVDSY